MEEIELQCFQIISNAGIARSAFIEAIQKADDGDFESSEKEIKEGQKSFIEAHKAHSKLIQYDAEKGVFINMLLIHAEDQLMSAEGFKIIAEKLINAYRRIHDLEKNI